MPIDYVIKRGDHLPWLAYRTGHATVDAVWNAPQNAALAETRPDPGVLADGDVVHVPDAPPRSFGGLQTRREHELVIDLPFPTLRLALLRPGWLGYADVATTADVDGMRVDLIPRSDGGIEVELGPDTQVLELSYAGQEIEAAVAWLQPIEAIEGWHDRLANLGYEPGGLEGEHARDPYALRSAIEEFQCDRSLRVDGKIGPATLAALQDAHGA